jgi:tetratricopeptide (TPR) repeat protein
MAGAAPWWYAFTLLWPLNLSPIYPLWPLDRSSLLWWAPLLASILVALGLLLRASRLKLLSWGPWHAAIMLAPASGLVVFANLALTYVSDHFLYPGMIGVALALGSAVALVSARAPKLAPILAILGVVIASGWGILAARHAGVFQDDKTLWSRAVEVSPRSYGGLLGLAEASRIRGEHARAAELYRKAIEIRPQAVDGHLFLGRALLAANDPSSAEAPLRRALELQPASAVAMTLLATTYERTRRFQEGIELFRRAVAADPTDADARIGLARMSVGFGRWDEAGEHFAVAVRLRPSEPMVWVGLAQSRLVAADAPSAVASLREGLAVNQDALPIVNMLAMVLATSQDDRVRNGREAVELANRAVRLSGGTNPQVLETLAAAQAEVGDFAAAVATATRASTLAQQAGDARGSSRASALAQQFQQRRPLRQ